ncbi:hypothetical protein [Bacillus cihuensis]|uniref:hypothetical protein n=1 Tax=Bacillus cihuensis TaxID=1208599 RepID=UPI00041C9457|nr:hypothetical protein [Bacillus cihuensis]
MEKCMSKVVEIQIDELATLTKDIRDKGFLLKEIELEYRKKSDLVIVRIIGYKNKKLSEKYYETIEQNIQQLDGQYISLLIKQIKANFTTKILVDTHGRLSLHQRLIDIKIDCEKGLNADKVFRKPFLSLLPFAEYITEIEFRGNAYQVKVMDVQLLITAEDLAEIVEYPLISPRAELQWTQIGNQVFKELTSEFNSHIIIPCIEGELYWESKLDTVQLQKKSSGSL